MEVLILNNYTDGCFPKSVPHPTNAGFDLYAAEDVFIQRGTSELIPLGIWTAFDPQYVALLWDRSGLSSKQNIHRFAGVIDASYRDEWKVCLFNHGEKHYQVKKGDKVIQVLFQKIYHPEFKLVYELPVSDRKGGFGTSGV